MTDTQSLQMHHLYEGFSSSMTDKNQERGLVLYNITNAKYKIISYVLNLSPSLNYLKIV